MQNRTPEILSPAGNPEKLRFAVNYGADAVYCALKEFGMRAAADNFTLEELDDALKFVHERGKRLYLTLNTLPTDNEIPRLEEILRELASVTPDAFIVADLGVMELIKESGIDVSGKECVIVGRSNIVGKPQAMLLLHQNGTVTICHSKTKNLAEKTKNADILVAAVGIPNFIKGDMIKEGAVVIDVGINRLENKKLCGDVEFESAEKVAGAITPVPGGVGPMTIAMLMKNTVKAAILNKSK